MPILGDMVSSSPAAPPSVRPRRVVTDRRGGRSASPYDSFNLGDHVGDDPADVAANRARVARELGVAGRTGWSGCPRCTGRDVAVVDGPQDGPLPETDAAGHEHPGAGALRARRRLRAGAAHRPGRRGRRGGPRRPGGRPPRASSPRRSRRWRASGRGPATSPRSSGRPCAAAATRCPRRCRPSWPASSRRPPCAPARARPGLDLRAGLAELLTRAGIPEVVQDPRCTVEDPNLFSHRRDGVTGRQAGIVWLG